MGIDEKTWKPSKRDISDIISFHLNVWSNESSAGRARPDELLDEGDQDEDDDSQPDRDGHEQDLVFHVQEGISEKLDVESEDRLWMWI